MAIKNTVINEFKSQGAEKVVKDTERIGRAQTRLGQSSASAGRQFSAQASGLGGLVAAYAGAAATIFAITAAFDALNRAARAEQTITGVNALANAIGESGPKILKGLQEITKGQLSIVQTAELANLALSSGFSADQINNLAEISLKASRALGRDLTDSFNRLVRGVTKLEPELLDELGIFTRLDPAVEAYAKSLGKTVGSLSNFERRQAFANAVAEEGTDKFRDIDTTANTSAESLEKLAATLSDLGIKVGGFIAGALQPLAEALSAPITAVGAFGILARTVFGTTLREARSSFEGFEDKVDNVSGKLVDKLGGGSKAAQAAVQNLGKELDVVNLRTARVSATNEEAFKKYVALGRAQQLSFRDAQKLQELVSQEIDSNKKRVQSLEAVRNPTKAQIDQIGVLNRRNAELSKVADATNARINTTGKVSRFAAAGVRSVGTAFGVAARGALGLLGGLTTLITVFSLFATIGSIVLDAFGWLDPVTEGITKLIRNVRIFLGLQEELIAQNKVVKELLSPDVFADVRLPGLRGVIEASEIEEATRKAIIAGFTGSPEDFTKGLIESLDVFRRGQVTSRQNIATFTAEAERLFETIFGGIGGLTAKGLQGINEFSEATGRTIKSTIGVLNIAGDELQFKGIEESLGPLKDLKAIFIDIKNLTGEERKNAIAFNETQIERLQAQEVQKNLTEVINSGAANAEQIEKRRSAVLAKINSLQTKLKDIEEGRVEATVEATEATRKNLAATQETFDLTDRSAQAQLAILNEREKILKTFSSEIKAAEKLNDIFSVIQEGDKLSISILDDKNKRRQNQVALLVKDFELGKEALEQERSGVKLTAEKAQLATLARDAEKALVGLFVQANEEARKLAEQLEKILQKETSRLSALQDQLKVAKAQRAVVEAEQEIEDVNKVFASRLKLFDLEQKLAKARRDAALDVLTTEQDIARQVAQASFMTDREKREFEIGLKQEQLDELRAFTEAEKANIRERVRIQKSQINTEIQALADLLGAGEGTIAASFEAQKTAETNAINARRDIQLSEIDLLEERNKGILTQAQSFTDHIQGIAEVLAADLVARAEVLEGEKFVENTRKMLIDAGDRIGAASLTDVAGARRARVELATPDAVFKAEGALDSLIARIEGADFEKIRTTIKDAAKAEEDLANLRLQNAESDKIREVEGRLAELRNKLVEVGIEGDIQLQQLATTLQTTINELNRDIATNNIANQRLVAAYKESAEITERYVSQGLMSLNTALIEGNLTFKSIAQGFRDMVGSMLREIQQAVFQRTIANPIAEFVGGLFASGGPIKQMAAGGNTMKRDRVATLLEPGEFVIRKEAAKKLGMSKLQELNAGISNDPIARIIAYAQGSKVKSKKTGGSINDPTIEDLKDLYGVGSRGVDPLGFVPGLGTLSRLLGFKNNFRIGYRAAPALSGRIADQFAQTATRRDGTQLTRMVGFQPGDYIPAGPRGSYFSSAGRGVIESPFGTGEQFTALTEQGTPYFSSFRAGAAAIRDGIGFSVRPFGATERFAAANRGVFGQDPGRDRVGPAGAQTGGAGGGYGGIRASGGLITRMAAGGQVRDRVPALLEPGEFVIRRPAAKAIGGAALNQMNATGVAPNIAVNVNNQGVPKNVSVAPPKMNGDKIILDIITRDLRNNGAIKKTLRRGK